MKKIFLITVGVGLIPLLILAQQFQVGGGNNQFSPIGGTGGGGGTNNVLASTGLNGSTNGGAITLSLVSPVAVANGGTATSVARSAGKNVGTYEFSDLGGNNGLSYLYTSPTFEGQLGFWYNGTFEINMQASGSTTSGDWNHGFNFLSGIQNIGGSDFGDSHIQFTTIAVDGHPSLWNATGDGQVVSTSFSSSSNNSGSGYTMSVMRTGFGLTNFTIVAAGSGYAVNDQIFPAGGTLFGSSICALIVSSIGGGGTVTGMKIFATGEYYTTNSGTVATTTGGSGTGLTVTCLWSPKGVHAMNDNSAQLVHVPFNRKESLLNGYLQTVMNADSNYNRGYAISAPAGGLAGGPAGMDGGNYSGLFVDWITGNVGVPFWVNGVYVPTNNNFRWAFKVSPTNGVTTANGLGITNINGNGLSFTNAIATSQVTNYTIGALTSCLNFVYTANNVCFKTITGNQGQMTSWYVFGTNDILIPTNLCFLGSTNFKSLQATNWLFQGTNQSTITFTFCTNVVGNTDLSNVVCTVTGR